MRTAHCRLGWLFLVVAVSAFSVHAQESASFVNRLTVAAGAGETSSASFVTTITLAEPAPQGASSFCNAGYRTSVGIWSAQGDVPVPVRLIVDNSVDEPGTVELFWSGADDQFDVYRSVSPSDVTDPVNLDQVSTECGAVDTRADQASLFFYQVVPHPSP